MKKKISTGEPRLSRYFPVIIILVPFLLYLSALRLGFVYFDDDILVLDNQEKLSHFSNLGSAFRSDAFFASQSPYYRPLMTVSFMADAAIGGKSPVIYHFSNLVYHLFACLSLFWLLSLMGITKRGALAGSLLFALHPMMGHAVLWIPARGDLLVTLFGLISFALLLQYLREGKLHQGFLHVLFFAGALFSKESAILFPVLFVIWFVVSKERLFNWRKLLLAGSWLLVILGWYYLRMIAIEQREDSQVGLAGLLRNLPFLPEAVFRFFFPFMIPVTPFFTIMTTLAGLVLIAIIAYVVYRYGNSERRPLVLFGALWFIGFSLPNMFVRLVAANDSFEYLPHRTYLLYAGFMIMLLAALPGNFPDFKIRRNKIIAVVVLILLSLTSLLQQRNYVNAEAYWGSAIRVGPDKAWFHYYMGRYYFKQQDYEQFERYLLKADSLKSYPEFKYHLGMVSYVYRKDYDKAYALFSEAFRMGFGNNEARNNFVKLCIESSSNSFRKGDYNKAIALCEEAIKNDPGNGVAFYNLGIYLVNTGEKQRAASMWKRAVKLNPDLTEAYRSLALYYHYDAKKADSAAWFAREFNNHGGTGNPISPQ